MSAHGQFPSRSAPWLIGSFLLPRRAVHPSLQASDKADVEQGGGQGDDQVGADHGHGPGTAHPGSDDQHQIDVPGGAGNSQRQAMVRPAQEMADGECGQGEAGKGEEGGQAEMNKDLPVGDEKDRHADGQRDHPHPEQRFCQPTGQIWQETAHEQDYEQRQEKETPSVTATRPGEMASSTGSQGGGGPATGER